jgi:pyrimidine-nucleoside phosphorylase
MSALIGRAEQDKLNDEDIAYLTVRLAESGEIVSESALSTTADIASTGGPSSLSTLLTPLYLRALGYLVPKLAVPGRPAGGIDVLAQIPCYRVEFTPTEMNRLLKESGYVHCLASKQFAPLDALFFSFRKRTGKINIPGLAIASLLAKKKAAGVSVVGLDVRVAPHGNFGTTISEATENAKCFCRVASLVGCQALCFLSDGRAPYQPYIGRGEALAAVLHVITGKADQWLRKHDDACYAMAHRLAILEPQGGPVARPSSISISHIFRENLEAQGAAYNDFEHHASSVLGQHTISVTAPCDGFLDVNLEELRTLLVHFQGITATTAIPFTDPCGIILRQPRGSYVQKGDLIATVRAPEQFSEDMLIGVRAGLPVTVAPLSDTYFNEVSYG